MVRKSQSEARSSMQWLAVALANAWLGDKPNNGHPSFDHAALSAVVDQIHFHCSTHIHHLGAFHNHSLSLTIDGRCSGKQDNCPTAAQLSIAHPPLLRFQPRQTNNHDIPRFESQLQSILVRLRRDSSYQTTSNRRECAQHWHRCFSPHSLPSPRQTNSPHSSQPSNNSPLPTTKARPSDKMALSNCSNVKATHAPPITTPVTI